MPTRNGLISMTFLTVCEAMYAPAEARLSTATTTPFLYLNASVVVPCSILTMWSAPSQRSIGLGSMGEERRSGSASAGRASEPSRPGSEGR